MTHIRIIVGPGAPERGRRAPFNTIKTAISNLKTAIEATCKSISKKHTPTYLGEFCWRTNHRKRMIEILDALCRAVAASTPTTRRQVYA